jgi:hypothetical protein
VSVGGAGLIEALVILVPVVVFELLVVLFGADSRDADDWEVQRPF